VFVYLGLLGGGFGGVWRVVGGGGLAMSVQLAHHFGTVRAKK